MEYNNIIVDTNVWVGYFNKDDSNHIKSLKYKNLLIQDQIMPDIVFYESLTVLRNKSKNNEPLNAFTDYATKAVQISIKLFYENNRDVLNLFIREHKDGLSYVDVLLLYLSNEYHILTFDDKLRQRIKEVGGKLVY